MLAETIGYVIPLCCHMTSSTACFTQVTAESECWSSKYCTEGFKLCILSGPGVVYPEATNPANTAGEGL